MKFIAWLVVYLIVFFVLESLGGVGDMNALVAFLAGLAAALFVGAYQKQH